MDLSRASGARSTRSATRSRPGRTARRAHRQAGVPQALIDAVAMNPREAERKQVAQLLSLWDTRVLTAIGGGGFDRFSELPPERREQVLLSWCDSRLPQRRAAFQALRKGALLFYYMVPGANGGRSPVWDTIGYAGPLGHERERAAQGDPGARRRRATPTLECDVCVIGSGAGGGTAAGVLAAAGLDVVVLEAGDYYDDDDFDGGEYEGYGRMYMYGGGAATHDQSVGLLAGSCLGGGTTVNYTTSFRTPDDVREEWASHGVPAFATDEYGASLDAVCERLGVNQEHNRESSASRCCTAACPSSAGTSDSMPRNVRGCDQGENCGYCGYGCRLGAKQSTVKTWLADAHAAGTRILVKTQRRAGAGRRRRGARSRRRARPTATASRCARGPWWRPAAPSRRPRCCAARDCATRTSAAT